MAQNWEIDQGCDYATLYSAYRMPHSSRRGPMDTARMALRSAIGAIDPRADNILEGVYSSSIEGFFDVENVVIYNLEPATFRRSSKHGLRARRSRQIAPPDARGFSHKLHYQLIPTPPAPAAPLVHMQFEPKRLTSVFDVWWEAANSTAITTGVVVGRYGLHVELSVPILPSNPATKMKVLLDGIVAALQRDHDPDQQVIKRLALKHGVDGDLIKKRLTEPSCTSISASRSSRLVKAYRSGVQWHPADDLCEDCTLIVTEGPSLCNAYVFALDD